MNEFLESLGSLLESEALANFLAVVVIALFSAITKVLLSKIKNDKVATAVTWMGDTVTDTVKSLQQTYVDGLKAAKADGKLTEAEKEAVKNVALATVKKSLSADAYKLLQNAYSDLDKRLSDAIEAAVKDLHDTN